MKHFQFREIRILNTLILLILTTNLLAGVNSNMTAETPVFNEPIILGAGFDWGNIPGNYDNRIWIIQYDYNLGGITSNLPAGVTLKFEGGEISNGTLEGDDTFIDANTRKIFETNISFTGTWEAMKIRPEWFGAVGNNIANDLAALQKTGDLARISEGTVYGPDINKQYRTTAELDWTGIRFIDMIATISTESNGIGVKVGNNVSIFTNRHYHRLKVSGNNTKTATVLIQNTGSTTGEFNYIAMYAGPNGIGVEIAPHVSSASFQHNRLEAHTFGCAIGVQLNALNGGWINENYFYNFNLSANSALGTIQKGIYMIGDYVNNNNLFIKPSIQSFTDPIDIQQGYANTFIGCRLEASGNIILGEHASANTIGVGYGQSGAPVIEYTDNSRYVNIVHRETVKDIWQPIWSINKDDFVHYSDTSGRDYYSAKLISKKYNDHFDYLTVDTGDNTWKIGSNDEGWLDLNVEACKSFRFIQSHIDTGTTYTMMKLQALDASKNPLPTLASGEIPYISWSSIITTANTGTGNETSIVRPAHNKHFEYFKASRSEVKYIRVKFLNKKFSNIAIYGLNDYLNHPGSCTDKNNRTGRVVLDSEVAGLQPLYAGEVISTRTGAVYIAKTTEVGSFYQL